jgi:molybdopterin converting factor small subunit
MVITVRLFAMFREGRFDEKELELPQGSSIADLIEYLEIPEKTPKILLVNGQSASAADKLSDGDVAVIFPMIAGG